MINIPLYCVHIVNTYYCLKIYSKNHILTKKYTSISIVSYNNLEEKDVRSIYLKGEKERNGGHLNKINVSRLNKMDLKSGI